MGYCVDVEGWVSVGGKRKEGVIKALDNDVFVDETYETGGEKEGIVDISFYKEGNYREDEWRDFTRHIAPAIYDGCITFHSEDYCYWRMRFDGHKWLDEDGYVVFPDDLSSLPSGVIDSLRLGLKKYDMENNK